MSLYSIDKLIEQTRTLAAEFRKTTGAMLPVSGEIARYDVSRHLGLELCEERNCGYDAIGKDELDGLRVLIKSRVIGEQVKSSHRIGQLNPNGDWDLLVLSLMDNDFQPTEMYMATREEVLEATASADGRRARRGALSVAKFRIIGELVWTRELGRDAGHVFPVAL